MNYTYLKSGDNLPTVGVLQKLLNRAGATLDSDGIFGPLTKAAVRDFQRSKSLDVDGVVGVNTWEQLVDGLDLPIKDCVDVFDSFQRDEAIRNGDPTGGGFADSYNTEVADIRAVGGDPLVLGGMSNGVEQAVTLIAASTSDAFLVRFHSHGRKGSSGVTSGQGGPDERNRINLDSLKELAPVVARLAGVFGPWGSLQFLACETGGGADGPRMLQQVASLVGVPVSAGINTQYAGGTKTFRFEGPTVTAVPNGQTLKEWCRALPDFPSP